MIKNRVLSSSLVIINMIYLIVLTFISDPFTKNYSMLGKTAKGYLAVLLLCILIGINLADTTYLVNRKYYIIALLSQIPAGLFPYVERSGNLSSNLHEILAYLSFALINIITILNIFRYSFFDHKKGRMLFVVYGVTATVTIAMYLDTMGAVAIEQLLLLSVILVLNHFIYLKTI